MVRKMGEIIKNYKGAILLAFLVGIIIVSPHFYFSFRYGKNQSYQEVDLAYDFEEYGYLAQIQEVRDGHFSLGNPYFKQGKDAPYTFQPLGPIIVSFLGKIFSLDLRNTVILARFLSPFFCFLVIYVFVFLISKDKLIALSSSIAILLATSLLSYSGFWRILTGRDPKTTLIFARLIHPQVSSLFFFSFLLFFWLSLEKKKWSWMVLSSLILGLSFYLYFYTWTFLYAFSGVLLVLFLFQKKWPEIKTIILILVGATLIGTFYFSNLYRTSTYFTFDEVNLRYGLFENRAPSFEILELLLFFIFLCFFPREKKEKYLFFLALVITPFIVLNQQIITSRTLISKHYHWYYHEPLAIIILLIILFFWIWRIFPKKSEFLKKMLAILIIGISIYTGIYIQKFFYQSWEGQILEAKRYGYVIDWLNEKAKKEEVVFADFELSKFIPAYTPLNVFYNPFAKYHLSVSNEQLINILFLFYRLDGVKGENAKELFFKERGKISGEIYGLYYAEKTGDSSGIPDEIIKSFIKKYQDSFSISTDEFLKKFLEKSEVKYLIWDTKNYPQWDLDKYRFLNKVYQREDFKIYQTKFF